MARREGRRDSKGEEEVGVEGGSRGRGGEGAVEEGEGGGEGGRREERGEEGRGRVRRFRVHISRFFQERTFNDPDTITVQSRAKKQRVVSTRSRIEQIVQVRSQLHPALSPRDEESRKRKAARNRQHAGPSAPPRQERGTLQHDPTTGRSQLSHESHALVTPSATSLNGKDD